MGYGWNQARNDIGGLSIRPTINSIRVQAQNGITGANQHRTILAALTRFRSFPCCSHGGLSVARAHWRRVRNQNPPNGPSSKMDSPALSCTSLPAALLLRIGLTRIRWRRILGGVAAETPAWSEGISAFPFREQSSAFSRRLLWPPPPPLPQSHCSAGMFAIHICSS